MPKKATTDSESAGKVQTVWVETDFRVTDSGRANTQRFFTTMRDAWSAIHYELVDQAGYVKLSKTNKVLWVELHARLPPYFIKMFQELPAGSITKKAGVGRYVLQEFHSRAPRHEDAPGKFLQWLRLLDEIAPPALIVTAA
mmetsp:Transcript_37620/g.68059  ORF Transcript_37620/g.68059 Transcript_37620/m.68059 type:complete len:141 (+) Transcript_37620:172-594(+)